MSKIPTHFSSEYFYPESFGSVSRAMTTGFWDAYYNFILDCLADEFPEMTPVTMMNRAIQDLRLIACEYEAERSLVNWIKLSTEKGYFIDKSDETPKPPRSRIRKFLASVKGEIKLPKWFLKI